MREPINVPLQTSLNRIKAFHEMEIIDTTHNLKKLLDTLDKTEADDEPLTIRYIANSTGFSYALWCLRAVDGCGKERAWAFTRMFKKNTLRVCEVTQAGKHKYIKDTLLALSEIEIEHTWLYYQLLCNMSYDAANFVEAAPANAVIQRMKAEFTILLQMEGEYAKNQ